MTHQFLLFFCMTSKYNNLCFILSMLLLSHSPSSTDSSSGNQVIQMSSVIDTMYVAWTILSLWYPWEGASPVIWWLCHTAWLNHFSYLNSLSSVFQTCSTKFTTRFAFSMHATQAHYPCHLGPLAPYNLCHPVPLCPFLSCWLSTYPHIICIISISNSVSSAHHIQKRPSPNYCCQIQVKYIFYVFGTKSCHWCYI